MENTILQNKLYTGRHKRLKITIRMEQSLLLFMFSYYLFTYDAVAPMKKKVEVRTHRIISKFVSSTEQAGPELILIQLSIAVLHGIRE